MSDHAVKYNYMPITIKASLLHGVPERDRARMHPFVRDDWFEQPNPGNPYFKEVWEPDESESEHEKAARVFQQTYFPQDAPPNPLWSYADIAKTVWDSESLHKQLYMENPFITQIADKQAQYNKISDNIMLGKQAVIPINADLEARRWRESANRSKARRARQPWYKRAAADRRNEIQTIKVRLRNTWNVLRGRAYVDDYDDEW